MGSVSLVPLIERPDLSDDCCHVLNEEWPKSITWRKHSMAKSIRPSPPMALLLLQDGRLVGHLRVCSLPEAAACWVESVVIRKDLRGKGLGKELMLKSEEFVRRFGYTRVYLVTNDKMEFYRRCGYENCAPIVHSITSSTLSSPFHHKFHSNAPSPLLAVRSLPPSSVPPPPVPPPIPPPKKEIPDVQQYMTKCI